MAAVKRDRGRRPTSPAGRCRLRRRLDSATDEPGRPIALDSRHRAPAAPPVPGRAWWPACRGETSHGARRQRIAAAVSLRYSWTSWTAMAPSPTAEATRLTEPWRTSPAAKTPGRLVSSSSGGRSSGQPAAAAVASRSGPVRRKPAVVARDLVGQPAGVGLGADQDEQRRRRHRSRSAPVGASRRVSALQPAVAVRRRRPRCRGRTSMLRCSLDLLRPGSRTCWRPATSPRTSDRDVRRRTWPGAPRPARPSWRRRPRRPRCPVIALASDAAAP